MITDENFNKDDIIDNVLSLAAGMEEDHPEAIATWTVDATLLYMVDWLHERGNIGLAELLEQLSDI